MQHAISNAGSLESGYYRQQDLMHDEALRRERLDARADEILGAFDAKDVMTAIDLVATYEPERIHKLYEALAIIPQLQTWKIEDPRMRAIAQAFEPISNYYAGYMAMKETPL